MCRCGRYFPSFRFYLITYGYAVFQNSKYSLIWCTCAVAAKNFFFFQESFLRWNYFCISPLFLFLLKSAFRVSFFILNFCQIFCFISFIISYFEFFFIFVVLFYFSIAELFRFRFTFNIVLLYCNSKILSCFCPCSYSYSCFFCYIW